MALLHPKEVAALETGTHPRPWTLLGARLHHHAGQDGVRFVLWAPRASRVAVVGDFNDWDDQAHALQRVPDSGLWVGFVPGVAEGARYQFALHDAQGQPLPYKADPYGLAAELRPAQASVVAAMPTAQPEDVARASALAVDSPISIYEVHAPSWRRPNTFSKGVGMGGSTFCSVSPARYAGSSFTYAERTATHAQVRSSAWQDWDALVAQLVPYVCEMGFTHIELLPISEHPFDGSWGYQPLGLYAPTARLGDGAGLRRFVDACHAAGLGVILDWVPAHFPCDAHGLGRFDGEALYEHADPREGFHPDWNTYIFDLTRPMVRNYLLGNALYWLECFGFDALRVDAVASMLYRDYSRREGEWMPNVQGGRENLESIAFLRELHQRLGQHRPGAVTFAEESSAFPRVTAPVAQDGLGFGYKWNLGWMHDTLRYMRRDPIHRRYHHDEMTFGMVYAYAEQFVLALSHDEVVHGKGSMLAKMPGDAWQQAANLRAYYGYLFAHPGKKLLFMGCEWGQRAEWNHDGTLDWAALDEPLHAGIQGWVRDLNLLLTATPALYQQDQRPEGFAWMDHTDAERSVLSLARTSAEGDKWVVVGNFTPQVQHRYALRVPHPGRYAERLNSDAALYGGSGNSTGAAVHLAVSAAPGTHHITITLAPLATVFLQWLPEEHL